MKELKICYEAISSINMADTWRDPDDIHTTSYGIFNTLLEAKEELERHEKMGSCSLRNGKLLFSTPFYSYAPSYYIRPVFTIVERN